MNITKKKCSLAKPDDVLYFCVVASIFLISFRGVTITTNRRRRARPLPGTGARAARELRRHRQHDDTADPVPLLPHAHADAVAQLADVWVLDDRVWHGDDHPRLLHRLPRPPRPQRNRRRLSDPFGGDDVDFNVDVFMATMLSNTKAMVSPSADYVSTSLKLPSMKNPALQA